MTARAPNPPAPAGLLGRVPGFVFVICALLLAVILGIVAGAVFAKHELESEPKLVRAAPGEFAPPAPRPVGVPSTPIPIPEVSAPLAIGFLDEQRNVAVPRAVVRAKVGDCVVARVQPKHGSAYRRLIGGERWTIAGRPTLEVRPGDAPGFCISWNRPSGKRGYTVAASAVIANDAGQEALGGGSARVIVQGTPKPQKSASQPQPKHGRVHPQPQATPADE